MDWRYFWRDHAQRNLGHLHAIVAAHRGRRYDLTRVSFDGSRAYGPVTIHRETALEVRFGEGVRRLRLTGSMAEYGGRWKLYSYVVD